MTVGSTDIVGAETFYLALGLELIVRNDHYLRFVCPDGGSTFSVDLVNAVDDDEQVTVYVEVDDVDAEFERLHQKGMQFEHPPADMPWLWREARRRDPDGHRLCIFYAGDNRVNPPWRL
jgi:catechol 2,3-dioxygenase-like lactoylglutathione lyase family enzyme